MWIRLRCIMHIERAGKMVTYRPGDWVDVGKQQALLWLSRGDAEIPSFKREHQSAGELGVVIQAERLDAYVPQFELTQLTLQYVAGSPQLAYPRTLCWNPQAPLRPELVGPGFGFLDNWEIAMPIASYSELALHVGSEEARARTRIVIRDLRVPLYDTSLIFARRCEATERLFQQWGIEGESGDDDRLTFLRAFYQVKPLMLALPATWHNPSLYAERV